MSLQILVVPMLSKPHVNADSNYVVLSSLARAMRKHRPDWHWYVIFPSGGGYSYDDDGFFRLPNVTKIPVHIPIRKMSNAVHFDASFFEKLFRTIAVDVVWCNLVESAGHLKYADGAGANERISHPFIVAAHNYVIHPSLPYDFEAQSPIAFQQLLGSLFCDLNVVNSDHCKGMLFDNACRWLSNETIRGLEKKVVKINYGILDPSLTYQESPEETIIAYNHRLMDYKKYMDTFSVLDELWDEGLRFRFWYLNDNRENHSRVISKPYGEIKVNLNREGYISDLKRCSLNVTNSVHETFCISAIESMALGQPLVAPNGVTFPEITNARENGYPYLFNSRKEQKEHLVRLMGDRGERIKWGRILSDHVRKAYASDLWAKRYAALFEAAQTYSVGIAEDSEEFIKATLGTGRKWALQEARFNVIGKRVGDRIPFNNQSMSLTKFLRVIRRMGARIAVEKGRQMVHAPLRWTPLPRESIAEPANA